MMTLREGEKHDVRVKCERTDSTGDVTMTTPQYRILSATRTVLVDWGNATWDDTADELYALFDSTLALLLAPGVYYVQLRGTIGTERYMQEVVVQVVEAGP